MAGPLNAKVILSRCSKSKRTFGIRIEQRQGDWVRTWAFPIDENKAKREKFDANTVTGSMQQADDYPGCPYCSYVGFVQCGGCGKISCLGGIRIQKNSAEFTCPWCGNTGELRGIDSITVSSGGY